MNKLDLHFHKSPSPRPVPVQESRPVPPAMFRLCHLVQFHDREAFTRLDEIWSSLHVLYVITSGQVRLIHKHDTLMINTGSAVARQAGTMLQHENKRGSLSPVQGIAVAFDFTDNEQPIWPFGPSAPITSRVIAELVSDLLLACSKSDESGPFKPHLLFYQLLDTLRDHAERLAHEDHSWLDLVITRIHEMVAHPFTREQLAREANVSPEHFSREFKKHTGLTFVEYVTRLRIRIAQEQLLLANPTLQELAQLTGYRDTFYLSRKFKQTVGCAPTLYRKTPKKIVSLTYNYTASLLALGHTPLLGAVAEWMETKIVEYGPEPFKPYYEHELINRLDLIADSRPDVILGYAPHSGMDDLRQIAPTILMPFEELDWQEQFIHLGRITGLEAKARTLLERYDTLQQEANRTLDQMMDVRGSAVCIFMIGESGAYIYGHGWGRASHILYHSLGFTPPARMEKDGQLLTGYIHVPLTEIHLYAADHIFIDYARESSEQNAVDKLFAQESWNTLSAVREGRLYEIDADMFYGFDPISVMEQLQHIMHKLTSHLSMH
ncbi:ABC transporter substrate-binding protein [Paenibacillus sp. F6_3S_P_1C]|uniref:ABC transporter substrate-binding protein n=1 Tax=Paenibacillus vandeheii TaxID=3035917 RepID=A0ABT8JG91_9BACL|nr:helix-turn-helix domain-containing protein [Paenibacillus vandeheii]MDN4603616.1 ABC transporter substrate-binding protein [Paenibacillus vandeheii]